MCIKKVSFAKCGCQVHEYEECLDINESGHGIEVQTDRPKWMCDYCRGHEALRRHHDAKELLLGETTEHGYLINSEWADFLREMDDLKDEAYYVKHCANHPEDENPYLNGWTRKQEAERMGTLTLKDFGGSRNDSWSATDNESWADFRLRFQAGNTHEPRFPGGQVPQRDKKSRTVPLVPLDELYPELKGRISQERTRASGKLRYAGLRPTVQLESAQQADASPSIQSQRAPADSVSNTAVSGDEGSGQPAEEHLNLNSHGSSTRDSGAITTTRSPERSGGDIVKLAGKTSPLPGDLRSPGGGPMRSEELSSPSESATFRSIPYPNTRPQNSGAPCERSIEEHSNNVQSDSHFPRKVDTPMSNNRLPSAAADGDDFELRQLLRPVEE